MREISRVSASLTFASGGGAYTFINPEGKCSTWIEKCKSGEGRRSEAESALGDLLNDATEDQLREDFLAAQADKGESVDEIWLRSGHDVRCLPVDLPGGGVDLWNRRQWLEPTTSPPPFPTFWPPWVGVVKHGNKGSKPTTAPLTWRSLVSILGSP